MEERRERVWAEVWQEVEEARRETAVELATQGSWTKWNLPKRRLTWKKLWRLQPFRISFLLRSVYDTLLSPANLARWGLRKDPLCKLCRRKGTLAPTSWLDVTQPAQGAHSHGRHPGAGQEKATTSETAKTAVALDPGRGTTNILQKAQGWENRADLGRKLSFPPISQTPLRSDIVIWS